MKRSRAQKFKDLITFPLRAVTLLGEDKWGLTSIPSERFSYVAEKVNGYCLDVGCGGYNLFINNYLNGNGKGIDILPYEGLKEENVITDISKFPFDNATFDTVTIIATINHIPRSMRDIELAESYRCLKADGNIIVTMGNPIAEILVHKLAWLYDKLFGTNYDMDSKRGMHEEEYYLRDQEIIERLSRSGFTDIKKKYFLTQWGLNHLFLGRKKI